jgi:uncharacterized Tic20 family protein
MISTRRMRIGISLIILSGMSIVSMWLAGVRLVSLDSYESTGTFVSMFLTLHWTVVPASVLAMLGLVCIVWPMRRLDPPVPPRL